MSELSSTALKVLEALPAESSVSGGKLKDRLRLSSLEFKAAKDELREAGLVTLGRGRGGTVTRIPDKEYEPPVKVAPVERMAIAREVKQAKSRERQEMDTLREHVTNIGKKRHPDADEIKAIWSGYHGWYVEVWRGSSAFPDFIPDELLL